jgi:hypothetical protein
MDAQGNTDVIDNVKKGWQSNFFERWAALFSLRTRPLYHCCNTYLLVAQHQENVRLRSRQLARLTRHALLLVVFYFKLQQTNVHSKFDS